MLTELSLGVAHVTKGDSVNMCITEEVAITNSFISSILSVVISDSD